MKSDKMDERPEYHARDVVLLRCHPANFDHAEGRPVAVVSIGDRADGETSMWALDLDDCRKLVTGLLVALATHDDDFAERLLSAKFSSDGDGYYRWPEDPEPFM